MNKWRRWNLFWMDHWVKITILLGSIILFALSWWGMASLESYYRNITLAQLPINFLMMTVNAVVFAYVIVGIQGGALSKLDKNKVKSNTVNVKFSDVIGIDEAKDECWEVVQLIKDHARLKKIGGKILRGILMMGPPGCGKTYLAKAIATEAGLPFLTMAASEFNEIFVGVGASRVRKLFKKAASLAYGFGGCIVFIDELDAMGSRRTFSQFGSGEGNTTQNQLLVAMDGLGEKSENIIVIGATNAAEDILDPALLRPGRFDRKVYIRKPSLEGREQLFKYYLGKVKYEASVDCKRLARKAIDKSPADIENIVKEAALIATRNKKDVVGLHELSEAIERIELGMKQKLTINRRELEMTAYHETGHLISTYLMHPRDDVFKASIIPRKSSLGVVHPTPMEEWHSQDRETLLAEIKVCLAGYVAEKVKFNTTTTGVTSDFRQAMSIAHFMVWRIGMGASGLVGDYLTIGDKNPFVLSEETKLKLNQDVDKIIKDCMAEVEALLRKESQLFDRFAQELITKQELDYDEIEAIFAEYGKVNPRRFTGAPPVV
ncbi:MAG TPA: AAA family ATPase [Candidatus Omnitrophota bacterium]|nr:AAA family ATPase [Candidatus Omnitrophota bacterium]HPS37348.1 AAA family ATPase [Candidatus Omnitrophota bacterium]